MLELPNFIGSSYFRFLGTIPLSFAPWTRVCTSRVPSPFLEIGSRLRVQRVQIKPLQFPITMNPSDFCALSRRLTGRTGLCGGLSSGLLPAHGRRPPSLSGLPSQRACHADPAGDCGGWRLSAPQTSAFVITPVTRRLRFKFLSRLISCGSSSFRPAGSYLDCFPSTPRGGTGTRSFRREPSNSTGGTFTRVSRHLYWLLRCDSK